jgi:hypothetical protein
MSPFSRRLQQAVSLARPSGPGFYPIETLNVAATGVMAPYDVQAAIEKISGSGYPAGSNGTKTLTLPEGTFSAPGFQRPLPGGDGNQGPFLGFLVPAGVSIVGSGQNTILQIEPDSITQSVYNYRMLYNPVNADAANGKPVGGELIFPDTFLLSIIRFNGGSPKSGQFTVRGTQQRVDGTGKLGYYAGISFVNTTNATATDIWVDGIPAFLNGPPGESMSIVGTGGSGLTFTRCHVDGLDKSGTQPDRSTIPQSARYSSDSGAGKNRQSGCGFGLNSTTNVKMYDCDAQNMGYSHGVSFYKCTTVETWNFKSINNGTGSVNGGGGGSSGDGINHEDTQNSIHHAPVIGGCSLTDLRYWSDSAYGDTTGHYVYDLVKLPGPWSPNTEPDQGHTRIRLDRVQNTPPTLVNCPTAAPVRNP